MNQETKQAIEELKKAIAETEGAELGTMKDEVLTLAEHLVTDKQVLSGSANQPFQITVQHGEQIPVLYTDTIVNDGKGGFTKIHVTEIRMVQWIENQAAVLVHGVGIMEPFTPPVPELQTIHQWAAYKGIEILDPDGFDRTDKYLFSRLFTEEEFEEGAYRSTIRRVIIEKPETEAASIPKKKARKPAASKK